MSNQKLSYEEIHNKFCDFIDSCGKYGFYTRSIGVQKDKIAECDEYLGIIKSFKYQAIERKNEVIANQFFHMQCMINALRSFLLMWTHLKESKFEDSWSYLIDAQEYIFIAIRINDYEGVRNLEGRIKSAEESVFPGWKIYNSPGFVETIGKCSICDQPFSVCEHIENEIYIWDVYAKG